MVTLVVPIYNMEQYLPRCMESLLHQSCGDYEILLINDGSTDSSGAMCDGYASKYPELIRVIHKANGGLSSARNAGIEHARGEFIIFPDPDDWAEPNYVQSFVERQQRFQADMVVLGHYIDTEQSSVPATKDAPMQFLSGYDAQRGLLLPPRMHGFSWIKLYRLELIRNSGLYFQTGMGTTEDLDFAYRYLARCQRVCYDPGCRVYHYCQRSDSATQSPFLREKMGTFKTFEHIIRDCTDRDPELVRQAETEICTAAVNLLWENESAVLPDPTVRRELHGRILRLLPGYLRQSQYGFGRKIQTLLAAGFPRLFLYLKRTARAVSAKHYEKMQWPSVCADKKEYDA